MAANYTASIDIAVRGQQAIDRLNQTSQQISTRLDEIAKRRIGPNASLNGFNRQLDRAAKSLNRVTAGTTDETDAVKAYVQALGLSNAARKRQINLVEDQILREQGLTEELIDQARALRDLAQAEDEASRARSARLAHYARMRGTPETYQNPIGPVQANIAGAANLKEVAAAARDLADAERYIANIRTTSLQQSVRLEAERLELARNRRKEEEKIRDAVIDAVTFGKSGDVKRTIEEVKTGTQNALIRGGLAAGTLAAGKGAAAATAAAGGIAAGMAAHTGPLATVQNVAGGAVVDAVGNLGGALNNALGGVPEIIGHILQGIGDIPTAMGAAVVAAMAFGPAMKTAAEATYEAGKAVGSSGLGKAVKDTLNSQTNLFEDVVNAASSMNMTLESTTALELELGKAQIDAALDNMTFQKKQNALEREYNAELARSVKIIRDRAAASVVPRGGFRADPPLESPSFERTKKEVDRLGESLALGAGFPLLFGGGPGSVAGSALGSFVGTGFGGQILGGALGQILDQAVQAASKLGNSFALVGNNYSSLREQGIEFTAEIERQVTAAKKLGDYTKAQELTRGAVFNQTGDVGGLGAQAAATAVNELQKAWNGVTKAVQTLLGFLGTPFIFALTAILRAVQGVAALINLIVTGATKLLSLIPGLNGVLNQAYQSSVKGTAEYENQLAELDKQIGAQNQVLTLEKSRTAISSQMVGAAKEQQKELKKQLKITELRFELDRKIAEIQAASPGATPDQLKAVNALVAVEKSIFDEKVKQLEVDFRIAEAKERELEIQKRQESQIRATAMLSESIVTAATTRLQNQASIASAATSAYLALNDLEMQRATNAGNTEKQYNLQLQRAQLIYQQTVLQVEQEQRKAQLAVLSSQIKLKELEATVAQKAAKGEALAEDYAAIELRKQAVQLAYEGVNAAKLIAQYNLMGANALSQMNVEQAAFNRTQAAGRAGGGGGGGGAIGNGGGGATVTSMSTTRSMGAATPQQLASQLSAKGLSGVFTEQQAITALSGLYEQRVQKYVDDRAAKGFKISPTSVSQAQLERTGFAEGGFVTRPTDAMVGEGGQPEYVIPASKMNDAMRRYSAGTRGEAVVSGAMSSGGANSTANYSSQQNAYYGGGAGASINITTGPVIRMDNRDYVTMTDMQRGMAAAAGASQANMMRSMSRSYATRRSMGL